jgi:hypothetical protein
VHRHHGIEEEGQIYAFGLASKLERGCVTIESPGAFQAGWSDGGYVLGSKETLAQGSIGALVDDLNGRIGEWSRRDDSANEFGLKAYEGQSGLEIAEVHWGAR